jgi:hypothetical protein
LPSWRCARTTTFPTLSPLNHSPMSPISPHLLAPPCRRTPSPASSSSRAPPHHRRCLPLAPLRRRLAPHHTVSSRIPPSTTQVVRAQRSHFSCSGYALLGEEALLRPRSACAGNVLLGGRPWICVCRRRIVGRKALDFRAPTMCWRARMHWICPRRSWRNPMRMPSAAAGDLAGVLGRGVRFLVLITAGYSPAFSMLHAGAWCRHCLPLQPTTLSTPIW